MYPIGQDSRDAGRDCKFLPCRHVACLDGSGCSIADLRPTPTRYRFLPRRRMSMPHSAQSAARLPLGPQHGRRIWLRGVNRRRQAPFGQNKATGLDVLEEHAQILDAPGASRYSRFGLPKISLLLRPRMQRKPWLSGFLLVAADRLQPAAFHFKQHSAERWMVIHGTHGPEGSLPCPRYVSWKILSEMGLAGTRLRRYRQYWRRPHQWQWSMPHGLGKTPKVSTLARKHRGLALQ